MNSTLLLLTTLLGSHGVVAFFVYRYVNKSWENKYKTDILRVVKKSREKKNEIKNLNDDELDKRLKRYRMQ